MLRGIFGAFRNPTAHEPRVTWFLSEQDALDALSAMSLLHRKLDNCVATRVSSRMLALADEAEVKAGYVECVGARLHADRDVHRRLL